MIRENILEIQKEIGRAQLIVVSKYREIEELQEVYDAGIRQMAENRVQELLLKKPLLPNDIEWHLIGHLQTNKVRSVLPHVKLIHSADSIKLLKEIEKESAKAKIQSNVLLQIHVAKDETKFGFDPDELIDFARSGMFNQFPNVHIRGVMSMSTLDADDDQVRSEFSKTHKIFEILKPLMPESDLFKEISMGMSSDYPIAVEEGATLVRVGSKIFI
ncbi:MAG: YggS family pyridoxal phosphate-dependent enzyme [Bacteroidetes bacterium]|nr:YggS family pyridoxal phosphate-dependent enzyme [Bacteroidota bacterium]